MLEQSARRHPEQGDHRTRLAERPPHRRNPRAPGEGHRPRRGHGRDPERKRGQAPSRGARVRNSGARAAVARGSTSRLPALTTAIGVHHSSRRTNRPTTCAICFLASQAEAASKSESTHTAFATHSPANWNAKVHPLTTIRDLLGHSSAAVTDIYLRRNGAGDAVRFASNRAWPGEEST